MIYTVNVEMIMIHVYNRIRLRDRPKSRTQNRRRELRNEKEHSHSTSKHLHMHGPRSTRVLIVIHCGFILYLVHPELAHVVIHPDVSTEGTTKRPVYPQLLTVHTIYNDPCVLSESRKHGQSRTRNTSYTVQYCDCGLCHRVCN